MELYAKKTGYYFTVVYARSAAHAHEVMLEAEETEHSAEAFFELSAWKVISPERIKAKGLGKLLWERIEWEEVEYHWDYDDWCDHGRDKSRERGTEGCALALAEPGHLDGIVVPAKS